MGFESLLIVGAGGHAKVLIDTLLCLYGTTLPLTIADENMSRAGGRVLGLPIMAPIAKALQPSGNFHVAIGDNKTRARLSNVCLAAGMNYFSVVHPRAVVASSAFIGAGSFVAAGAILSAECTLGTGTIVNHGAVVDHDCRVGAFCHLAQNATLGGGVTVGDGVLIGPGAILVSGISVGESCLIGPGAKVLRDLPPGSTYGL